MDNNLTTELISGAYKAGYKKCLEDTGLLPKYFSQNQAYKKYKRRRLERWVKLKLITPIYDNNKKNGIIYYERERLELLDSMNYLDRIHGIIPPEKPNT